MKAQYTVRDCALCMWVSDREDYDREFPTRWGDLGCARNVYAPVYNPKGLK